MKNYRFEFKIKNDNTIYTFQGTNDALKMTYGYDVKILKKESCSIWDENLKKYI